MLLSRASVGTMIMMAVGLMGTKLLIRDDDDDNASKKAMQRDAGLGNYKFNVSGAARMLKGESTDLQKGDYLVSYDWIEPVGKTFSLGAAIYQERQKGGTAGEIAMATVNQGIEEILDIPTLSVVKSMVYAQSPVDVLLTPFTSGASGFVLSPIRQTANISDPIARNAYSGTPLEKAGKQILNSLPILNENLEPQISPTGDVITNNTELLGNLLSQYSPATVTKYTPSPILDSLISLENRVDDKGYDIKVPFPTSKAPSSLKINGTYNGKKYDLVLSLTDEQKTASMKAKGK